MKKAFNYNCPANWTAESDKDVPFLALAFHKFAVDIGIQTALLLNATAPLIGWDKCLQSNGFNVKFSETDYGCQLEVYVFDDNDDVARFSSIWKLFVDKGIVWGGPYKGSDHGLTEIWKPWDHMEGATKEEIELVFAVCTFEETLKDLSKILTNGRVNQMLTELRDRFNIAPHNARIPCQRGDKTKEKDWDRNEFRREWAVYLSRASEEEKEKYQKREERIRNPERRKTKTTTVYNRQSGKKLVRDSEDL